MMIAVWAIVVFAEDGVWNVAMSNQLNRAIVVAQLLLGDDIRLVAMYVAVDTHNAAYNTRYCANVV